MRNKEECKNIMKNCSGNKWIIIVIAIFLGLLIPAMVTLSIYWGSDHRAEVVNVSFPIILFSLALCGVYYSEVYITRRNERLDRLFGITDSIVDYKITRIINVIMCFIFSVGAYASIRAENFTYAEKYMIYVLMILAVMTNTLITWSFYTLVINMRKSSDIEKNENRKCRAFTRVVQFIIVNFIVISSLYIFYG